VDGFYMLELDSIPLAVVGSGIQMELDMPLRDYAPTVMEIAAPIRGRRISEFKEEAFNQEQIAVSGIFAINAELDAKINEQVNQLTAQKGQIDQLIRDKKDYRSSLNNMQAKQKEYLVKKILDCV
jgi:hypothetical protein